MSDASEQLKKSRNKVKALQKKPQPEQRSEEWFKQRQTRITASEAASCLFRSQKVCEAYVQQFGLQNFKYKDTEPISPYETREDYLIKKCAAFYGESVFKDNPATLWGKKYEEVANRLYNKLYNTSVIEFGLLPHSRLQWLAASPDGITPDGVMLEIKCPKSRKIDERAPPLHYWIQMQIQLEVCNLDFCDYLECEIEELQNEQDFLDKELKEKQDYGIIFQMMDSGPDPKYIYPPAHLKTSTEYVNWKDGILQNDPNASNLRPIYFLISKYNTMRVSRSKEWFAQVKGDLKSTWELVMKMQGDRKLFDDYKESIHKLRNKEYYERFHNTVCMIDDASTFVLNEASDETVLEENMEVTTTNMCMIDSTD